MLFEEAYGLLINVGKRRVQLERILSACVVGLVEVGKHLSELAYLEVSSEEIKLIKQFHKRKHVEIQSLIDEVL